MSHHLLLNNGSHQFNTVIYLQENQLPFMHSQGLIDFDLDGDLDIVAIEKEGDEQFYIFQNNGIDESGNIILKEVFSYIQTDGSTSRTLAIADYDNDGDQDVYIPRKYGINWLFENQTLTGTYDNVVYNETRTSYLPKLHLIIMFMMIHLKISEVWAMVQHGVIMIMTMIMIYIYQIGA